MSESGMPQSEANVTRRSSEAADAFDRTSPSAQDGRERLQTALDNPDHFMVPMTVGQLRTALASDPPVAPDPQDGLSVGEDGRYHCGGCDGHDS